jgi:hypothetical protein
MALLTNVYYLLSLVHLLLFPKQAPNRARIPQSRSAPYFFLVASMLSLISLHAGAATYYVTPANSLSAAIASLYPGDTLILKDGIYSSIAINCSSGVRKGTALAPITIRAENERKAFIKSDGSRDALRMSYCSYWNIEGLRVESQDNPNSTYGAVLIVEQSDHVNLRRIIGAHNNRYGNTHIISLNNVSYALIEECEAYYYHRHAFSAGSSSHIIFRRNFGNSRGYADLRTGDPMYPSGTAPKDGRVSHSNSADEGDEGITFYWTSDSIAENNIVEHSEGVQATGKRNKLLGNVSLEGDVGISFAHNCQDSGDVQRCGDAATADELAEDNLAEHNLSVNSEIYGAACDSWNCTIKNMTVIGAEVWGFISRDRLSDSGAPGYDTSFNLSNSLFWNSARGIEVAVVREPVVSWLVEYSNIVANSVYDFYPYETPSDTSGHIQASMSVVPTGIGLGFGQCMVFIPSSSNMKGRGKNGADIGANILYRYQDGVLTNQTLWNPTTGEFPHGAIVPGLNDVSGSSAFDVHKRLNVNYNGCSLPAGYGGSVPSPAPVTDVLAPTVTITSPTNGSVIQRSN